MGSSTLSAECLDVVQRQRAIGEEREGGRKDGPIVAWWYWAGSRGRGTRPGEVTDQILPERKLWGSQGLSRTPDPMPVVSLLLFPGFMVECRLGGPVYVCVGGSSHWL